MSSRWRCVVAIWAKARSDNVFTALGKCTECRRKAGTRMQIYGTAVFRPPGCGQGPGPRPRTSWGAAAAASGIP
eukprot:2580522-Pyramimonas_sp.AAC.1